VKPAAVVASTSTVQRQQHLLQQQHHLAQQQQQQHQMLQQQQLQQQWRSISGGRPESNFFHIHPRKVTEVLHGKDSPFETFKRRPSF